MTAPKPLPGALRAARLYPVMRWDETRAMVEKRNALAIEQVSGLRALVEAAQALTGRDEIGYCDLCGHHVDDACRPDCRKLRAALDAVVREQG